MSAGESVGSGPDKRLVPFIASGNKIMTLLRSCTKLLHSPTTPTLPCNMQCHAPVSCSLLPDSLQNKAFHHHHHFLHFAMLNAELIYQWTVFVRCCHNAPCLPALCATGAAPPGAWHRGQCHLGASLGAAAADTAGEKCSTAVAGGNQEKYEEAFFRA